METNVKKRTFMFIVCYIAYTSTYIARLNLTMSASELQKAGFSASQIGLLGTIFAMVYAVGRLVNGVFSDKKPPYIMICSGLIIAGLANITVGFLPPFIAVAFLWAANAFGQSMLWGSVLCFVAAIYPPEIASKKTSLMTTSIATGNVVGILLGMFVISSFGLRFAFIVPGAITLVLSLAVLLTMNSVKKIEVKGEKKKHQSIFVLLKDKEILTSLFPVFIHGMIKENVSLWMSVYFIFRYKVDLKASAYFILFIPIAGFIGRTFYSFFFKISKDNEHLVTIFSFVACVIFCIPLIVGTPRIIATICLGLIYACASIINTSFISIYPLHYVYSGNVASVCGVLDLAAYGGTAAGSYVFGLLIDKFAGSGYVAMFAIWAITSIISALIVIPLAKKRS